MQYYSEHAMQQRAEAIAIEKYDGDGEALVKGRVPRRQMVGQRVVVDYEEESTVGETVLVRYAGVVVDYTVWKGLHVKFDGYEEEQDWAWVEEEGEDDWEWEGGAAAVVGAPHEDAEMPPLVGSSAGATEFERFGYSSKVAHKRARCTYGDVGQEIATGVHASPERIKEIKATSKAKGARARSIWKEVSDRKDATDGSDDVTNGQGFVLEIFNFDHSLRMAVRGSAPSASLARASPAPWPWL